MKLLCWLWLFQLPNSLPVYSVDSLVNAASQTNDRFAANSVLTLYGKNLAFTTAKFVPPAEPRPGWLYPLELGGAVLQTGTAPLELFYVSPTQINFRLPAEFRAGNHAIQLVREGGAGPRLMIRVREVAPELFTTPDNWILATRVDGSVVTADTPVRPGETVVFYGTGFGPTITSAVGLQTSVNWLQDPSQFIVSVNGEPLPGLYYVGVTPGYSGLYQVNYTFSDAIKTANPEIRVTSYGDRSRAGTRIWFTP